MELNLNELLQTAIYAIVTVSLPVIFSYFGSYLKAKRDEKLLKIENEKVREVLFESTNVLLNVVDTVTQTYVEDLKKQGKFSVTEQKFALEKAIDQTKNILSDDAVEIIENIYSDLDEWIRTSIEAYINDSKKK